MKNTLKAILAYCFFRIKFDEPKERIDMKSLTKKMKWEFTIHPRKLNLWIPIIIFSPIIILVGGVPLVIKCFKDTFRVLSFSSFELTLEKGEKPKKFEAYKKF